ncbi:hypothetical protein B7463_g7278, partial [Scytalidium lignicola]
MAVNPPKRRNERLNRRKRTLISKAHEFAEFCDVDVALIIRNRKSGRYFTYNSVDLESWPPSKEQIVTPIVPDASKLAPARYGSEANMPTPTKEHVRKAKDWLAENPTESQSVAAKLFKINKSTLNMAIRRSNQPSAKGQNKILTISQEQTS